MKPDWRIYYSDGTTFDSNDGEPHEAPSTGFICAVAYDEDGVRYIMHGWNHYRYDVDSRQWWGMDDMGVFDTLRRGDIIYAYKEGRTITRKAFLDMMARADKDVDFPREGRKK